MIENWLRDIDYGKIATGIEDVSQETATHYTVYSLSGTQLIHDSASIDTLTSGIYIINGNRTFISR